MKSRYLSVTVAWLLCGLHAPAQQPAVSESSSLAAAAVVQIPSHGVSGTVIWSGERKTYILSCAHGHQGASLQKKMTLNVPSPNPGAAKTAAIRLVAHDFQADLTLIELGDGPLPYVCPVAPRGHVPGRLCLSVGYDEMQWPATQRPATILAKTETRERPWHGRSGGALIDEASGRLVGVCHGYTGPKNHVEVMPGAVGLYVDHATICTFLERQGWFMGGSQVPQSQPQQQLQIRRQPSPQRSAPNCPT